MSHLFFAASRAQSSSQVELHTRNCSSPKTAVPFITFSPTSPSLSHLTDIDYVISCLTSFMDDSIIEREGNSGSDALSIDTAALNYWRYVRPALIRLLLLIKQMGDALIWRLLPDTGPDFVCCTDDRLGDGHFFKQISICVLGRPNNSHLFGNITINKVNLHWWNLLWFLCYYYLNDTNGSFRNKVTTVAWWMVASLYLSHSRCCHLS